MFQTNMNGQLKETKLPLQIILKEGTHRIAFRKALRLGINLTANLLAARCQLQSLRSVALSNQFR